MLDAGRPAVALIARPIDITDPGNTLPLTGDVVPAAQLPMDAIPIWVSEAMVDLYGFTPGKRVTLPIAVPAPDFVVAGVWRDYGRQFGAIQMRLKDYQALSGDLKVNDAALWLEAGVTPEEVIASLRRLPFGEALEFAEPGQIRALSLNIFDRSFAVTYLLEGVAIIIGLLGVAASFSAQALARRKEFGVLRHIGVTRRANPGYAGGGRRTADFVGRHAWLRARLVHQPDSCLYRKPAIVPLDHAARPAMEGPYSCCRCATTFRRAHRGGVGSPFGLRQRDTRSTGGLVMLFFTRGPMHIGFVRHGWRDSGDECTLLRLEVDSTIAVFARWLVSPPPLRLLLPLPRFPRCCKAFPLPSPAITALIQASVPNGGM